MTDGTLLIHGPTDNGNGAIDYEGTFALDGGTLIAAGSSGMLQTPGSGSSQYTRPVSYLPLHRRPEVRFRFPPADGEREIVFTPSKQYTSLIIGAPGIAGRKTHDLYGKDRRNRLRRGKRRPAAGFIRAAANIFLPCFPKR